MRVARNSACQIIWRRWETTSSGSTRISAACSYNAVFAAWHIPAPQREHCNASGLRWIAARAPVFPACAYRHYEATKTVRNAPCMELSIVGGTSRTTTDGSVESSFSLPAVVRFPPLRFSSSEPVLLRFVSRPTLLACGRVAHLLPVAGMGWGEMGWDGVGWGGVLDEMG